MSAHHSLDPGAKDTSKYNPGNRAAQTARNGIGDLHEAAHFPSQNAQDGGEHADQHCCGGREETGEGEGRTFTKVLRTGRRRKND